MSVLRGAPFNFLRGWAWKLGSGRPKVVLVAEVFFFLQNLPFPNWILGWINYSAAFGSEVVLFFVLLRLVKLLLLVFF